MILAARRRSVTLGSDSRPRLSFTSELFKSSSCNKKTKAKRLRFLLVGVRGFEPPASWSRTKHSTKLSHTPINIHFPRRNHPTRRILYRNIADLSISERKKLSTDGKNFFILPSLLKIHSLLWYNITVKNFSERI